MRSVLKTVVAGVLYGLYRALDPVCRFSEMAVLAYHSISDDVADISIEPDALRSQLAALRDRGYVFVDTMSVTDRGRPGKFVVLTFDDGYADFETTALSILEEFHAPATVFVVGDAQAARANLGSSLPLLTDEAIERLRANPLVTIGYHSRSHRNLAKLEEDVLAEEVAPRFGARLFAYPGGNYSEDAIAAVRSAGYDAAFSIKSTLVSESSDRFLLPRVVITKKTNIRFAVSRAQAWYRSISRL